MGGSNGHSDELSCGETYNPSANEWTQVPELRTNRCNAGKNFTQLIGQKLSIGFSQNLRIPSREFEFVHSTQRIQ